MKGPTICNDARHLGGCKLCSLLAFVAIKDTYQAAVHLVVSSMLWLEVWQRNMAVLLVFPLACSTAGQDSM